MFRRGNSSLNGTGVYPIGIRVDRNETESETTLEEVAITLPVLESSAESIYKDNIPGIVFALSVVSGLISQEHSLINLFKTNQLFLHSIVNVWNTTAVLLSRMQTLNKVTLNIEKIL